jgi:phosphoribosylanthranilate isomerase
MFRIKICGVTSAVDAQRAAEFGADAIGLNFYPGSRRYLATEAATEVAAAIPRGVRKVGVFVNADPKFACDEFDRLDLDLIQLAGDETTEYLQSLGGRPVMKAFRPRLDDPASFISIKAFLANAELQHCMPRLLLIDTFQPGEYGGTGRATDWPRLLQLWNEIQGRAPALVLAGGLTPKNVRAAIQSVRPAAVDVASGVESSAGLKDSAKLQEFVAEARTAFNGTPGTHPRDSDRRSDTPACP